MNAIKAVLSAQEISCQGELLRELGKMGFKLTQATLSRDLKQLKVAKSAGAGGKYVYVLPSPSRYRRVPDTRPAPPDIRPAALSVKFSGNLGVVRTLPGHASHIAYDIDNKKFEEILGTLAGDDTIILVLAEGVSSGQALRCLSEAIPGAGWA